MGGALRQGAACAEAARKQGERAVPDIRDGARLALGQYQPLDSEWSHAAQGEP